MICTCCGSEIKGNGHGPYRRLSGVIDYACDRCWSNPAISFPDKVLDFPTPNDGTNAHLFSGMRERMHQSNMLRISALALRQGSYTLYIGKMKSTDILCTYDLKRWSTMQLDGYQRGIREERKREIARYLKSCPLPVVPPILVSIRGDSKFTSEEGGDVGILEIPKRRGSIILIDGQHRVSGFEWHAEELMRTQAVRGRTESKEMDSAQILNYEVPVLFLDSESAAKVLHTNGERTFAGKNVRPEDVERVVFYTLNKTQRGIAPSLKDMLQLLIQRSGMRGLPAIEHEGWRVDAAEIGYRMNEEASPFEGMINLSGVGNMGPIQLTSFVTSMKPLFSVQSFRNLGSEAKYKFVKTYWGVLRRLFRKGFVDHASHLILKSIGIYALNWLAADIYLWCDVKGIPLTDEDILRFLRPLKGFNWRAKSPNCSPLKAFGGTVGVRQAYKMLLKRLAKAGISEAKRQLTEPRAFRAH